MRSSSLTLIVFLSVANVFGATGRAESGLHSNRTTKAKTAGGDSAAGYIKKAQGLLLENDRESAVRTVLAALARNAGGATGLGELKRELFTVTEMFVSEKGQRTFELGRSLAAQDLKTAKGKFLEALSLEKDNLSIIRELARVHLAQGECQSVYELSRQGLLYNPYNSEIFLLRLQAKACLGTLEDVEAELSNPYVDMVGLEPYIGLVRAQAALTKNAYSEAIEELNKAKAKSPSFPEIYFWMGKAQQLIEKSPREAFTHYVTLCREKVPSSLTRSMEPRLCRQVAEIEKTLEAMKVEKTE